MRKCSRSIAFRPNSSERSQLCGAMVYWIIQVWKQHRDKYSVVLILFSLSFHLRLLFIFPPYRLAVLHILLRVFALRLLVSQFSIWKECVTWYLTHRPPIPTENYCKTRDIRIRTRDFQNMNLSKQQIATYWSTDISVLAAMVPPSAA